MTRPPEHGGRLREAAQRYATPIADWLDLSTGINPHAYPVPPIPPDIWQRLPEDGDGLEEAAASYYGSRALLPVAGTQAAILALPTLLPGTRVTIAAPGYAEHAWAWRARNPHFVAPHALDEAIEHSDIVVLANPNNPCGTRHSAARLAAWRRTLAARGGWLIVDEAFIDDQPDDSLVPLAGAPGLVVLRSPGKFFGLAGARAGFVFAPDTLRTALATHLGPWAVSGPARHAVRIALADRAWQQTARRQLAHDSARLTNLLREHGLEPHGTALFQRVLTPHAVALADYLAQHGVLVRRFDNPSSLRFGLPGDESAWARLNTALDDSLSRLCPT